MSDGTRSEISLPDECLPINALATDDFVTYYVVQGQYGGGFWAFNLPVTNSRAGASPRVMARMVGPSFRPRAVEDILLHALLLRNGRALQMLLTWDCQHSLLVSL